jgi:hypothetical protein
MGHGNHWEAIFPTVEEAIRMLPTIIHHGGVISPLAPKDVHKLKPGEYAAVHHPADQPLSYLAAIRAEKDSNQLVTFYPAINDGEENELEIESIAPDDPEDGDFEGIISAINPQGVELTFFEPRFPINKTCLSERMVFKLAAIAYSVELAKTEFEISFGPLVDLERERVAKEGGDPASVTSVTVFAGELRCYLPHGHADFEFQSVVEEVSRFTVLNEEFFRLKILLGPKDENPVAIALFVSKKAAGGLVPKVGDALMGTGWLQGLAISRVSR